MQKFSVEIEVLSPIHIWNWNTVSWIDYYCLQKKLSPPYEKNDDWKEIKNQAFLYKFKMKDLLNKILDEKDSKKLLNILEQWNDTFEIRKFIFNVIENNKNYQEKLKWYSYQKNKITNIFYNIWKCKMINKEFKNWKCIDIKNENSKKNQLSQLNIQEFINSLWRCYIPWSSLKGSIRTCLINRKLEENNDAINDVFKKLIVRDSSFVKDNIEIWKLARQSNQWDGIYAEFLHIWTNLITEIIVKDFLDENNLEKIDFSKENIVKKINNYTKKKIKKYIEQLKELLKHPDINKRKQDWELDSNSGKKQQKIKTVIESFKKMKNQLENLKENECILNIWFWWWYWFKILEEIEEKHPKFCSIHWNWEPDNWCYFRNEECNSIAWMPLKHLKDNEIQIPRTNWQIDLKNLWFIKLTFKD